MNDGLNLSQGRGKREPDPELRKQLIVQAWEHEIDGDRAKVLQILEQLGLSTSDPRDTLLREKGAVPRQLGPIPPRVTEIVELSEPLHDARIAPPQVSAQQGIRRYEEELSADNSIQRIARYYPILMHRMGETFPEHTQAVERGYLRAIIGRPFGTMVHTGSSMKKPTGVGRDAGVLFDMDGEELFAVLRVYKASRFSTEKAHELRFVENCYVALHLIDSGGASCGYWRMIPEVTNGLYRNLSDPFGDTLSGLGQRFQHEWLKGYSFAPVFLAESLETAARRGDIDPKYYPSSRMRESIRFWTDKCRRPITHEEAEQKTFPLARVKGGVYVYEAFRELELERDLLQLIQSGHMAQFVKAARIGGDEVMPFEWVRDDVVGISAGFRGASR